MPKVKIYTTATCVYCRAEKAYLKEHKVDFEEIHVDEDPKAAEEMFHISGQLGVPFTVITQDDGKTENILGFDQARLSQAVGIG